MCSNKSFALVGEVVRTTHSPDMRYRVHGATPATHDEHEIQRIHINTRIRISTQIILQIGCKNFSPIGDKQFIKYILCSVWLMISFDCAYSDANELKFTLPLYVVLRIAYNIP